MWFNILQNSEPSLPDSKGTDTKEIKAEIKLIPDEMKKGLIAVETKKETIRVVTKLTSVAELLQFKNSISCVLLCNIYLNKQFPGFSW